MLYDNRKTNIAGVRYKYIGETWFTKGCWVASRRNLLAKITDDCDEVGAFSFVLSLEDMQWKRGLKLIRSVI